MKPGRVSHKDQLTSPLIVKLGGSLFNQIGELAPILNASTRPLFIIPGGGPFADLVRQVRVNNDAAHWMAIAAMEQYGWFISSFGILTTEKMSMAATTTVLLPYRYFMLNDILPHTWDVTSDTIAAWVAGNLNFDLLLLKSVDGIFINGILQEKVTCPIKTDVVDPCFIPFVIKNTVKTTIINGSKPDRVVKYLNGDLIPRTDIGTTF